MRLRPAVRYALLENAPAGPMTSQAQTPFGLFVGNALASVELGKPGLDLRQKDEAFDGILERRIWR